MKINHNDFLFAGRGSSALYAILKSLNMRGVILLPVNICEIIYPIVKKAGFSPVFYDVDASSGNGSLKEIQKKYTGAESVLLAVHNFGVPLEIDRISQWAQDNNIFLIEDVCNALGAQYKSRLLGVWGDAAIFSFGYAKIIEFGAGGAATVRDSTLRERVSQTIQSLPLFSEIHKRKYDELQSKLRKIRIDSKLQCPSIYGPLYESVSDYLLYRIDQEMETSIRLHADVIDLQIAARAKKAFRYRSEIKSKLIKHVNEVEGQIYWRYNLLVNPQHRKSVIEELIKNDVLVSTWYPPIINMFEENCDKEQYAGAYAFGDSVINLFVDQRVSQSDVSKTVEIINNIR